jgi:hypothetical protein
LGDLGGGVDFLMPGRGVTAVVESVEECEEEMCLDVARNLQEKNKLDKEGAVKLTSPLSSEEIGLDQQWPWDICGGFIGGA